MNVETHGKNKGFQNFSQFNSTGKFDTTPSKRKRSQEDFMCNSPCKRSPQEFSFNPPMGNFENNQNINNPMGNFENNQNINNPMGGNNQNYSPNNAYPQHQNNQTSHIPLNQRQGASPMNQHHCPMVLESQKVEVKPTRITLTVGIKAIY
eukprot:UN31825